MNWTDLFPESDIVSWIEILQPTYNSKNIQCKILKLCKNTAFDEQQNTSLQRKNDGFCRQSADSIHETIKHICLIPLTILIIGINFTVLLVIGVNRKFHNITYILIAALGFADLSVGFVSIGTLITRASEKTLELCLIRIGFTVAACVDSLFILMLIAIDRYIAVFKGLRYSQIVTKTRVFFGIFLASFVALVAGFLPLMGWRPSSYHNYCSFLYVVPANYIVLLFSCCVSVPIIVMFGIYGRIYRNAQFHIKRIESIETITQHRSSIGQLGISQRTIKSLKTLMIIFGCVLVTWIPFLTASVIQLICREEECFLKDIVGTHLLILGFSNSFLNPVIYALGTRDFREKFIHTCFRKWNYFPRRLPRVNTFSESCNSRF